MPRENRPCKGGIAGPRVNWKRNWELEQEDCSVKILHSSLFTVPQSLGEDLRVSFNDPILGYRSLEEFERENGRENSAEWGAAVAFVVNSGNNENEKRIATELSAGRGLKRRPLPRIGAERIEIRMSLDLGEKKPAVLKGFLKPLERAVISPSAAKPAITRNDATGRRTDYRDSRLSIRAGSPSLAMMLRNGWSGLGRALSHAIP